MTPSPVCSCPLRRVGPTARCSCRSPLRARSALTAGVGRAALSSYASPAIDLLAPSTGKTNGGEFITITGTNFCDFHFFYLHVYTPLDILVLIFLHSFYI